METVPVVVVNWNGLADTVECVRSLLAQEGARAQVHVVDNGSGGREADRLEETFGGSVRLHRSEKNLGFAGGNNVALRRIAEEGGSRFVALLNNDAEAEPGWLAALVAAAGAHEDAGLFASCMVFHDDPRRIENAGIEVLSSWDAVPRGRNRPVEEYGTEVWLLGACAGAALYRADMLRTVGLFDESFFANFEDVDLSLRAVACGWKCLYVPGAVVRHRLNRSVVKVRGEEFNVRSLRNAGRACLVNLPLPVLALDLPWVALRDLAVFTLGPLLLQFDLVRTVWKSRVLLARERREILEARRQLARLRRGTWSRVWRMQRSFFPAAVRYLRDVVIRRRRRFLQ